MKSAFMFFLCFVSCLASAAGGPVDQPAYVPHGPEATARFEEALFNLPVAAYIFGISPREDILTSKTLARAVPPRYLDDTERWLKDVLNPRFANPPSARGGWVGVSRLHPWDQNVIVGNYSAPGGKVRFVDLEGLLNITVFPSDQISSKSLMSLGESDIQQAICSILRVPEEKKSKLNVEKHIAALEGTPICYGVIRFEYDEKWGIPLDRERGLGWWSYIPFWIGRDRVFVCISTMDWKHLRASMSPTRDFLK